MKVAIFVLAFVLSAPAFAAEWAPVVSAERLSAAEVPAASPARSGPRDGENYTGAEELLIKEFGITWITMDIPEAEVVRQDHDYNNAFCFEHALRLALLNILEDHTSPSSPLARELASLGALQNPTKLQLKKARQNLVAALDKQESFIALARPYMLYQPGNGESVDLNWVFFLRLSGRTYWVVLDRSGEKGPYTYGN